MSFAAALAVVKDNWRLIVAVILAVVIFVCGWSIRGWLAAADMAQTLLAFEQERVERIEAANKAIAAAEKQGRDITVKYEATKRDLTNVSQKLKTEVLYAHNQAIQSNVPVCTLSPEWVRIYDEPLRPSGDSGAPTGESASAPTGAANPAVGDRPALAVSEWDVLWVHTENATRWAACRAQLNALIDFSVNDGSGVVTQESPHN